MKKLLFLTAAVCLFAISVFAQKTDFSGTWTLDVSKSKLDERARASIESMTMSVTQTDKELKVATVTKRVAPAAGAPAGTPGSGTGGGGGMGRGGGFGSGDSANTYSLDGKETTVEVDGPNGKIPVKLKATIEANGTAKLSSSRTFTTQMGDVTASTNESWSLSADGKTLTVSREQTTPRGTNSSTLVFAKK